ncbi:MAG: UDP-3-O-acyl-N-acetylglucosamine deacetylase [Nitrospiria bacterium]
MVQQKTISNTVSCNGVGLHSGKEIHIRLLPANAEDGILFVRKDLGGLVIPANEAHVIPSQFSTIIGVGGATVQTVEHLLAAVSAVGIDNLIVELDGPEVPAMDGSALPFMTLLRDAGISKQSAERSFIEIMKPIKVSEQKKSIAVRPGSSFEVSYKISFDHPVVSRQSYRYGHNPRAFLGEIAPARTFAFLKDIPYLRSQGFAMGGSLDNAVVIGEEAVLNEQGLRFADEFVRHKILDLIGDISLLGKPILGHVEADCSGHQLHTALVKEILKNKKAWRLVSAPTMKEPSLKPYPAEIFQSFPLPV